jgi:hypothetical protein
MKKKIVFEKLESGCYLSEDQRWQIQHGTFFHRTGKWFLIDLHSRESIDTTLWREFKTKRAAINWASKHKND